MNKNSASINSIFGDQLRQARRAAGISQEKLAERASLDRSYISLLERGIKSPTLNTFFRLCYVLDQKPEEVIARMQLAASPDVFAGERWNKEENK